MIRQNDTWISLTLKIISVVVIVAVVVVVVTSIVLTSIGIMGGGDETEGEYIDKLNNARVVVTEYIKLENKLYSVENYEKYIGTIKKLTTREFYNNYYSEDGSHLVVIPHELPKYKHIIDTVVVEKVNKGYKAMVYASEVHGEVTYPYTAIIELSEEQLVDSLWKIPHRF